MLRCIAMAIRLLALGHPMQHSTKIVGTPSVLGHNWDRLSLHCRRTFLKAMDPEFYLRYIDIRSPDPNTYYGNRGLTNTNDSLLNSDVTDSRYLCHLGTRRKRLTSITVKSRSCHVQVMSAEGDEYRIFAAAYHK
jgi:hypothetical protein